MSKKNQTSVATEDFEADDEEEKYEDEIGEGIPKASKVSWSNEGKDRDRLIGKMLRLTSQFCVLQEAHDENKDISSNESDRKMVYVRGHKAVNHIHEFLQ